MNQDVRQTSEFVIPAKAGIHFLSVADWIPACVGMTESEN